MKNVNENNTTQSQEEVKDVINSTENNEANVSSNVTEVEVQNNTEIEANATNGEVEATANIDEVEATENNNVKVELVKSTDSNNETGYYNIKVSKKTVNIAIGVLSAISTAGMIIASKSSKVSKNKKSNNWLKKHV